MSDELPPFVTPIRLPGEPAEPLEIPKEVLAELKERLAEIDRARASAMAHAHEVVVWR